MAKRIDELKQTVEDNKNKWIKKTLEENIIKAIEFNKKEVIFQTVGTNTEEEQNLERVRFQLLTHDEDGNIYRCDDTYNKIKLVAEEFGVKSVKEELIKSYRTVNSGKYRGFFGAFHDKLFERTESYFYREMTIEI